jgi:hypothetical protein
MKSHSTPDVFADDVPVRLILSACMGRHTRGRRPGGLGSCLRLRLRLRFALLALPFAHALLRELRVTLERSPVEVPQRGAHLVPGAGDLDFSYFSCGSHQIAAVSRIEPPGCPGSHVPALMPMHNS